MQIIRTVAWVLLLVLLVIFTVNNWSPVVVKIWEGVVLETKLPALVIVSFLLGLVPMWLLNRSMRWRMGRRISALETAARGTVTSSGFSPGPSAANASEET